MESGLAGLDADNSRKILNAPWYGRCGACGNGTLWFGDTEEEVTALVEEHVKTAHVVVWRNAPSLPMP
jgi:hypothetical protein